MTVAMGNGALGAPDETEQMLSHALGLLILVRTEPIAEHLKHRINKFLAEGKDPAKR